MSLKEQISQTIKTNRPKLSASSVKTYVSILTNIFKAMHGTGEDIKFFDNDKDILEYLKDKPDQTKKTALSALFVLTKKEEYRTIMLTIMASVNAKYKEQIKDPKQAENWMSTAEIQTIYNGLLVKAISMLSNKEIMNAPIMMEFLLLAFLGGVSGIPPRRSLDYALLKIKNYDVKTDNYYKNTKQGGKFYFNVYKTAKNYGLQTLDVPKPLNDILKKWCKLNKNDYMLYSTNENPLTSQSINRILNGIFGKKVSTDLLRQIYISNVYKNVPALEKMETLASNMGHSLSTALEYIKH